MKIFFTFTFQWKKWVLYIGKQEQGNSIFCTSSMLSITNIFTLFLCMIMFVILRQDFKFFSGRDYNFRLSCILNFHHLGQFSTHSRYLSNFFPSNQIFFHLSIGKKKFLTNCLMPLHLAIEKLLFRLTI